MTGSAAFDILFFLPFAAAVAFMAWVFWSLYRELKH
jgi:hypothetical protein